MVKRFTDIAFNFPHRRAAGISGSDGYLYSALVFTYILQYTQIPDRYNRDFGIVYIVQQGPNLGA